MATLSLSTNKLSMEVVLHKSITVELLLLCRSVWLLTADDPLQYKGGLKNQSPRLFAGTMKPPVEMFGRLWWDIVSLLMQFEPFPLSFAGSLVSFSLH